MSVLADYDLTATDQFCGAGGTSTGAAAAGITIKLALNHWRLAVESHNTNHPDALHDCADISAVNPRRYPKTDILFTSPECTNHTLAKNHAQAANALTLWDPKKEAERSRATMWDVPRFAEVHRYRLIIVENVIEVRSWELFDEWVAAMAKLGYDHGFVYFNSRFAGAPQSRDRLYTILWQRGLPKPDLDFDLDAFCQFCEAPTRARQRWTMTFDQALAAATRRNGGVRPERIRYGNYKVQYHYHCEGCGNRVEPASTPAWTAIDWTLPGERIGDGLAHRPKAAKTLERIQKGIDKYAGQPIVIPMDHMGDGSKLPYPVWRPFPTQTARQDRMLVHPFLVKLAGNSWERPGTSNRTRPVTDAAWGQTCTSETGVVNMPMLPLIDIARGGGTAQRGPVPVTEPTGTVSAEGNHHFLVDAFYDKGFTSRVGGADMVKAVTDPFGTVTASDHHGMVQVPLIDTYYGQGSPARPVTEPATTARTHDAHGLVDPGAGAVDIMDCRYRMLQPHEIQRVMAFPDSYVLLGDARAKVRQLGNAVTPPVARLLAERIVPAVFG